MRIFFDTEFQEDGKTIELISIGMVREDGATYYAEVAEYDYTTATNWLKENVIPKLTGDIQPRSIIAEQIKGFVGEYPEFWADYASYDWVALCQLYGTMMDIPKTWPYFVRDMQQLGYAPNVTYPGQTSSDMHHALKDALWLKGMFEFTQQYIMQRRMLEILPSMSNSIKEESAPYGGIKLL